MKIVIFYEKPGCATNAKQKKSLRDAGCMVFERNLLNHGMSVEELFSFFEKMPVSQWFNLDAPQIKKGEIDPNTISKDAAMQYLLKEPILIKRPLILIKSQRISGFDQNHIEELLQIDLQEKVSTVCSVHHESCNEKEPMRKSS